MAMKISAQPNATVFNAVRAFMSPEFQTRIPEATIENMKEIGLMITSDEYEAERNQWQKALMNRIGMTIFHDYTLQNRLAKYIREGMSFGDTIEEIATDIVSGKKMDYGKDGESVDPFIKMSPQAKAIYHRINEPIQYGTTIEKDRLRRAFLEEGGLSRLVGYFVNKLYSSANLDTWLLTKSIFATYANDAKAASGCPLLATQKITSQDITDEASGKKFLLQIKDAVSSMYFPNAAFNPMKVHKTLDNRELTLFIRADLINKLGVEVRSGVFHLEELNIPVKIELMDDFGEDINGGNADDIMAMLAEDDFLVITSQFEDLDSIYNPRGRYMNYFLTRQMSFGCTYFKDCVIFRKNWG